MAQAPSPTLTIPKVFDVRLNAAAATATADQALWSAIRNRTDALAFNQYAAFINRVLCEDTDKGTPVCSDADIRESPTAAKFGSPSVGDRREDLLRRPGLYGVDSYQLLKLATQAFLLFEAGLAVKTQRDPKSGAFIIPAPPNKDVPGEESRRDAAITFQTIENELGAYLAQAVGTVTGRKLPYLKRIIGALVAQNTEERLPYCEAILQHRATCPSLLELIWSYWHEEGMLVQTMNAISWRFQNRGRGVQDPLANLELDPLRPLNHLLWGFIQDEQNRLSVQRRAYEYDHHYGITVYGRAVANFQPADSRSKFIRAFHHLLYRAAIFFQEEADTTVLPDGFPLLNALRDVHLILAEGAHNQFGDLPWTGRVEMLIMEWLLARPEMREFLRGRHMVPYREEWMGAVDAMKKLQGWSDVAISHFRDLGVFGEQIILSVRYGDWVDVNDQDAATNWARYWRPEIQSYIYSYLATTGVDLATEITDARGTEDRYLQPSMHLRNRLAEQRGTGALPAGQATIEVTATGIREPRTLPASRRALLPAGRRRSS